MDRRTNVCQARAVPPFGRRLGENSRKCKCMGNGGEDAVLDRENRKTLRSKINITSELLTQALSESNSGLAKSLKLPRPRNTAFLKANHTKFSTVFLLPDTKQSENHQPSVHYEMSTRYMGCYLQQTKQHHIIDRHHKDRSPDYQARHGSHWYAAGKT